MLRSKTQMRRLLELVQKGNMSRESFERLVKATPDIDELPEKVDGADDQENLIRTVQTIRRVKQGRII